MENTVNRYDQAINKKYGNSSELTFHRINDYGKVQVFIYGHKWFTTIDHEVEKVINSYRSISSKYYY